MKTIKLLLLFLISFSSFAQYTAEQRIELDKKIYKTELFLKKIIMKDLGSMLSTEGVLISVSLKVDEKQVHNEIGGLDDKWDTVKTMQLPGLFLGSGDQETLKEVKGISEENILANITDLNVSITVSHEDVDLNKVKELTELIIKSNYSRTEQINLVVDASFSAPIIVPEKVNFSSKIKGAIPYIFAALVVAGIFLFALFSISKNVKQSLDGLNDVIAKKDLSGSLSLKASNTGGPEKEEKQKSLPQSGNMSAIDQYYTVLGKIKENLSSYYEVISQMIAFNFNLKDYEKLVVLMEALPQDKKETVYASVPAANVKSFKNYIVFNGDDLYSSGERLLEASKDIVKMLSLSSLNQENFYSYYLKEIASGLTVKQISVVIEKLTINELMYFIEFVDKASLGFAIASSDFDSMKLSADYKELSQDEIKSCVDKISKLLMTTAGDDVKDPRASILPYLTGESEEVVMRKLNIEKTSSFDYMVEHNLAKVITFIKEQDYEEMVFALALFKEALRDEIIVAMPDILAERLLKETYKLSKESLIMKSIIMTHLDQQTLKLEQSA